MSNAQTFGQYLVEHALPDGITVTRPVDAAYLKELLVAVHQKDPGRYPEVVSALKRLGDRLSTLEGNITMGLAEIKVPDKGARDAVVAKYKDKIEGKAPEAFAGVLEDFQKELAAVDRANPDDPASVMMASGIKKGPQLMKLRTTPGMVRDHARVFVPVVFPKAYAEGMDPLHYWLGAVEGRANLAEGQVNTAAPGELQKVMANVLNGAVVSTHDCGTLQGILLDAADPHLLGRYLAAPAGGHARNTLVTADVQQDLVRAKAGRVVVRSPQTCQAPGKTVCAMCMGLRVGTGKPWRVGDNAGLVTSGSLSEPLTQMSLSAKHSVSLGKPPEGLTGEKGFRKLIEMPEAYDRRQLLCEVYGVVDRVAPAPQGGQVVTIRTTKPVPERYVVNASPTPRRKGCVDYYVPPNVHLVKDVARGLEVYPGQVLTDGFPNLKDIARLKNLGLARSAAAQAMFEVFKNSGNTFDRRHFELLARAAHPYVRIERAPAGFALRRGEVVDYNRLVGAVAKLKFMRVPVEEAVGATLTEGVLDLTVGTELSRQLVDYLQAHGVDTVKVTHDLEVSPATTPMTRVVDQSEDFLAALNHRRLKAQIQAAAATGKQSDLHGYNPITAFAYGAELRGVGESKAGEY